MAKLMQKARGLSRAPEPLDVNRAVGQRGTVYLTIPRGGRGQVQVVVQERLMTLDARTRAPTFLPEPRSASTASRTGSSSCRPNEECDHVPSRKQALPSTEFIVAVAGVVVVLFFVLVFIATRFKRCPSNRVLVIYGKVGKDRTSRCIHGGGAFIFPLIQDYGFLDLLPRPIDIDLIGALSKQNIRVNVPSTFTVGISTSPRSCTTRPSASSG